LSESVTWIAVMTFVFTPTHAWALHTVGTLGHMATRRKPRDERKEESIRIRVTTSEKEAWEAAAERDGRDLSGWLRFIANREADGRRSR
jgi:hypothetical protein